MYTIEEIYKMLEWGQPPEEELKGVEAARKIKDLSLLIMPPASASVWDSFAKVLCEKSDDELTPYLSSLFEWLYDWNWPGADDIYNRLLVFDMQKLVPAAVDYYRKMIASKDGAAYNLTMLLDNPEFKRLLPEDIIEDLAKYLASGIIKYEYFSNKSDL